jgi:tetratricopeptide repeat protein
MKRAFPRPAGWLTGLVLCLPAAAAQSPADASGSLEAFLRRVRTEREAEFARLRPRVDELVKKLGLARSASDVKKLNGEMDALGSEAVPLLVPYIDPGPNPSAEQDKQAQEVAAILSRARSPALLEELVHFANGGSPKGRLFAVRVLGDAPEEERERALAALRALHPTVSGSLRAECVRSLARLSVEDPLVIAALSDTHPEVIAAGLVALTNEPRKQPRPEVVALLADSSRGADVLDELVDYFCVPGQALDEEIVVSLVRFACREDLEASARLKVLDGLPRFGVWTSRLRKEIEPLLSSSDSGIKDATLIALTLLKDGKARRDLMRFYDDQVKENERWPLAYQRRGDVELKIGEYKDAARDYQDAIRLHGDSARLPGNRDLWVNLARAYVRDGKLKAAHDTLADYEPTSELRRILRTDPDFRELVEHPKYKSLFE